MKRGLMMAAVLLTGCGQGAPDDQTALPVAPGQPDGRIFCAPPGEAEFRRTCSVDRVADGDGAILTVRLPDGGFHRLRASADGRAVEAADGAQPALVRRMGDRIEVEVGGARYRLPAVPAAAPGPEPDNASAPAVDAPD